MNTVKTIPGFVHTGRYVKTKDGKRMPIYESKPRTDNKPDINTKEGWTLGGMKLCAQRLEEMLHRIPTWYEVERAFGFECEMNQKIVAAYDSGNMTEARCLSEELRKHTVERALGGKTC